MQVRAFVTLMLAVCSCSSADPMNLPLSLARAATPPTQASSAGSIVELGSNVKRNVRVWSAFNQLRGDAYALDDIGRRVDTTKVKCDPASFQTYKGKGVPYAGSVMVDPAFIERLERFEAIVNQVALEVYGRTPTRLLHAGAYSCRTSRNRQSRLSEHALGNALDVVGFSFPYATKAQRADLPKLLHGAFKVTVRQHWSAEKSELGRLHRDFLRKLARAVVDADVFRVALGPSHPGHGDHLHFDMSPWHYVNL